MKILPSVLAIAASYEEMNEKERAALTKLFEFACRRGEMAAEPVSDPGAPAELPLLLAGTQPGQTLADQILEALPALIKEFPKGPTVKQLVEKFDVAENFVRAAMFELYRKGRAQRVRRDDSQSYHLIPIGYIAPPIELTVGQRRVLEVMKSAADPDNFVKITKRAICAAAPVSQGSITAIIDSLIRKGFVTLIESGVGTIPSTYCLSRDIAEAGE